jgi:hypothetical protein
LAFRDRGTLGIRSTAGGGERGLAAFLREEVFSNITWAYRRPCWASLSLALEKGPFRRGFPRAASSRRACRTASARA